MNAEEAPAFRQGRMSQAGTFPRRAGTEDKMKECQLF